MKNRKDFGKQLIEMLNLTAWPVGVDFISSKDARPQQAQLLKGHRYCQALMKAREGSSVLLDSKGISCPAAAAAFGFRPLPENLQNGRGLVGFGIVQEQNTGARMFEGMSYFPAGQIDSLHLYPLGQAERLPDVVVMEDEPEKLMWISLAYLNLKGGNGWLAAPQSCKRRVLTAPSSPIRNRGLINPLAVMVVGTRLIWIPQKPLLDFPGSCFQICWKDWNI